MLGASSSKGSRRRSASPSFIVGRVPRAERRRHRGSASDELLRHPDLPELDEALFAQHGNPMMMAASRCSCFRSSRSGLSGFETGVAVMPLVAGNRATRRVPAGRIRTQHAAATAALIMSVLLIGSALVTTLLIPPEAFPPGGAPTGARSPIWRTTISARVFGTIYDISTIAILWFAGASAMAGC